MHAVQLLYETKLKKQQTGSDLREGAKKMSRGLDPITTQLFCGSMKF